jgi:hypothetical protein
MFFPAMPEAAWPILILSKNLTTLILDKPQK